MQDSDWKPRAACRGDENPDDWFATGTKHGNRRRAERAKRICKVCPVQRECGQWAEKAKEPFGIWGGMQRNASGEINQRQLKPPPGRRDREPVTRLEILMDLQNRVNQ